MYMARLPRRNRSNKFVIRHSYRDGNCYRSRDLFDLGMDPSRFIVYPGGNSFYIDTALEDAIAAQGIAVSQEILEPLFKPFLTPHIRRVIDSFDRNGRNTCRSAGCEPSDAHHRFDRCRLQYLKLGDVRNGATACIPARFYQILERKSRDEIEHDFMTAERGLRAKELCRYVYQIFHLQRYFNPNIARCHPHCLDQERMDHYFIQTLCRLNQDPDFWLGTEAESGLRQHLVRYVIMYFDNEFPAVDPLRHIMGDFFRQHRRYHPPRSVQISLAESAQLLGVSEDELKKMDCRALTRQYRKQALKHHPDKGGKPETFVKLNASYHKLLKRKAGS